jgi:hypothetical protein
MKVVDISLPERGFRQSSDVDVCGVEMNQNDTAMKEMASDMDCDLSSGDQRFVFRVAGISRLNVDDLAFSYVPLRLL